MYFVCTEVKRSKCSLVPRPLPRFQLFVTLKTWEWPRDEAKANVSIIAKFSIFSHIHSGKFLRVQTFAKMSPEAPEEISAVLICATKPSIVHYQLGC